MKLMRFHGYSTTLFLGKNTILCDSTEVMLYKSVIVQHMKVDIEPDMKDI